MNRKEMFEYAEEVFQRGLKLAAKKNSDYARPEDPFFNFRRAGLHGFATRIDDKSSRILNLSDGRKPKVDESLEEDLLDMFNYCWLALAFIESERAKAGDVIEVGPGEPMPIAPPKDYSFFGGEHPKPPTKEDK